MSIFNTLNTRRCIDPAVANKPIFSVKLFLVLGDVRHGRTERLKYGVPLSASTIAAAFVAEVTNDVNPRVYLDATTWVTGEGEHDMIVEYG